MILGTVDQLFVLEFDRTIVDRFAELLACSWLSIGVAPLATQLPCRPALAWAGYMNEGVKWETKGTAFMKKLTPFLEGGFSGADMAGQQKEWLCVRCTHTYEASIKLNVSNYVCVFAELY